MLKYNHFMCNAMNAILNLLEIRHFPYQYDYLKWNKKIRQY